MSNSKNFIRLILIFIGAACAIFAVVAADESYTRFLLGERAKELSWGVLLFRSLLFFHGILLVAIGLFFEKFVGAETVFLKDEAPKTSRSIWIILTILTAIAFALRLVNLNSDLWVDEVYTLLDFARQPIGEILTSFPSQNQHLLYSILARGSLNLFGESAWALRLPAVLFGAASVPALFLLCGKLIGARAGILAAALLTVSYHHIWFSQNARGYTGLLFFTILATRAWLTALEKNDWQRWLIYAAMVVGGMWMHMTMAFVVAAHGIVYLVFLAFPNLSGGDQSVFRAERRAGLKPLIAWILSVTVTAQLYALALPEFLREGLHEESRNSEWTNPFWVLTEIFTNLSIGFAGLAVVLIGAAFVAFGWLSLFNKNRRAAILMVLPPFFAGALMLGLGHNLFPRFFFFAMGFGLIIIVHGGIELPKFLLERLNIIFEKSAGAFAAKIQNSTFGIQNPIGTALVLLIIAASIITVPRNYALPKQNFSGAKNYIETNRQTGDAVVAVSMAGEIYNRYYDAGWQVAKDAADLANAEKTTGKIWLLYTLSPEIKAFRPEVWRIIETDYQVVRVFPGTLNGGEIYVCQRRTNNEEKNETSRNFGNGDSVRQNGDAQ